MEENLLYLVMMTNNPRISNATKDILEYLLVWCRDIICNDVLSKKSTTG